MKLKSLIQIEENNCDRREYLILKRLIEIK